MPSDTYRAITAWAEEDRPREKLLLKGKQNLTDAELLAILIGSGTIGESAVTLAQRILASANDDLNALGKKSLKEFQKFKGVGLAKAITIAAALELGRRRESTKPRTRPRITRSEDAFQVIAPTLVDLGHEEFWLLLLNKANEVVGHSRLSTGGMSGTVVDAKLAFRTAIDAGAAGIIAVHNHPSGNLQPSQADLDLTKKLRHAGALLDLPLLDHLIVSDRGYYSFADEGTL